MAQFFKLLKKNSSLLVLILLILTLVSIAIIQYKFADEANRNQERIVRQNILYSLVNIVNEFNREVNYLRDSLLQNTRGLISFPLDKNLIDNLKKNTISLDEASTLGKSFKNLYIYIPSENLAYNVNSNEISIITENNRNQFDQFRYSIIDGSIFMLLNQGRNSNIRLVMECDLQILLNETLPTLSKKYIPENSELVFDILIRAGKSGQLIFTTSENKNLQGFEEFSLPLFMPREFRGPPQEFFVDNDMAKEDPIKLSANFQNVSISQYIENTKFRNFLFSTILLSILLVGLIYLYVVFLKHQKMIIAQHNFISSVSHEIKTPIAVLRAAAENLKEGLVKEPDATQKYGERMLLESERLLNLTENVLRYARLDSHAVLDSTQFIPCNLKEILTQRIQFWQIEFSQIGAIIELECKLENPIIISDLGAINAVFENIISNAFKHGMNGGADKKLLIGISELASISNQKSTSMIYIIFKDFGKGMQKKHQKHIFEAFYRIPKTHSNGIGLGLNLVKKLVHVLNGTIQLDSSEGNGSTFEIALPRRQN